MSAPAGEGINDNEYKSRTGQSEVPVVGNNSTVESGVNPATEDSDATLGMCNNIPDYSRMLTACHTERDEKDAIDQSNIVSGRTRGAAKQNYTEPGDEEGLPGPDNGTSRGAQ